MYLLIHQLPTSDLADDEKEMLTTYMDGGGHVMVLLGVTEKELPNLQDFMKIYGIEVGEGYAADTKQCYQNNVFAIFPEVTAEGQLYIGNFF